MPQQILANSPRPRRIDLHCHSSASTEADEAVLNVLQCPESYSDPAQVYAQAKRRGMDFVTITDHDSIDGVLQLGDRPDVLVGEELTCYFPEDACKMHVLIWGITRADHDALQQSASDIYEVASIIEARRIAHAVAHPVYRQNDRLERWHLERLILLFKGFECLNGSHSMLHRQAFEPLLDKLTRAELMELSGRHGLEPLWQEPWIKSRTAGSDDHGLFNVGRTWTEFLPGVETVSQVLECLREGRCRPGGEAGSSLKLAHNFFGVGVRYVGRQLNPSGRSSGAGGKLLEVLVGDRPAPRRRDLVKMIVKDKLRGFGRRLARPLARPETGGTALLAELFGKSMRRRFGEQPALLKALVDGAAPLGEHEAVFGLINALNRDIFAGIAGSVSAGLGRGQVAPLFDSLSALAGQQFMMLPYYFALFHQNRERPHLARVTGHGSDVCADELRVAAFSDLFDGPCDVSRLLRRRSALAGERGRHLIVHTCSGSASDSPGRRNFRPMFESAMPFATGVRLCIPPIAEVLEWADRQQFDAVHIDTPGPMGVCGWLVARMLRVPILCSLNVDLPSLVHGTTGDFRLTSAVSGLVNWLYGQATTVLVHGRSADKRVRELAASVREVTVLPPGVDADALQSDRKDVNFWCGTAVNQPRRLLYRGRVSAEQNLALLVDSFRRLCRLRQDTALVVVGEGPYLKTLRQQLSGQPVYVLPEPSEAGLPALYAACDLLLWPSLVDPLPQAVLEAQACGLPVVASSGGVGAEMMDDGVSGLVLPADDPGAWARAMDDLLDDEPLRQRMARTAPRRVARFSPAKAFDAFWEEHLKAVRADRSPERAAPVPAPRVGRPARTDNVEVATP